MSLEWTDKQDGIDDIMAEDINKLAHAIIEKGEWVKIMDKTLTADEEGISKIRISKDDDGNSFSLKKIYVDIQSTSGYQETKDLSIYVNDIFSGIGCLCYLSTSETDKYITIEAERVGTGLWKSKYYKGQSVYHRTNYSSYNMTGVDFINKIEISRIGMKENMRIMVYGVK